MMTRRPSSGWPTDLAAPFEGLRLEAYHDPVGYPTQGYGRLLSRKPWEDRVDGWPDIDEDARRMTGWNM